MKDISKKLMAVKSQYLEELLYGKEDHMITPQEMKIINSLFSFIEDKLLEDN